MKTVTFTGETSSAWGEKTKAVVPFDGSYSAYENALEVRNAGAWPSESDICDMVNAKQLAAAKAKSKDAALVAAGYAKPDLSDPAYRRKRMIADYVAMGVPQDVATQQVDAVLNALKK